ncbi:MAG: nucleoside hydrolase [Anaerolineales bacterium]|nr:nucleoside hydrolase [Anaerolineales bacterium]MCB0010289.1 nucleoside hydrolase [Anaerolineales bacterium]MCB0017475.1 nucleoside hydrolase [Anaerolineales bacterium]MCB8962544.1 nucleoside hydrolase [Ardenticatenales bacterium]
MSSSSPVPQRIIIDTDPGVDDSMAILFAFCSPEVEIVGLTTIFGNGGSEITTANALRLVELAGRPDVPVARGAETPLLRPFKGMGWMVHGRNGLGNVDFPAPKGTTDPRRAAQFIVDTVMASPGEITLVPLGPLTNIALAVMLEPKIAENVKEVVLMGGAANAQGNASATAEANIRNDPEAAKIVFEAPWKVTMVGLDVTRMSIMTPAYVEHLKSAGNKYTDFIGQILPHYMGFYKQSTGLDGLYVHDSSALAYVIDPSLFTTRHLYVHVETASPVNFGHTTADWRLNPAEEPNVHVCVDVDHERFLNLYQQRLMEA